MLSFQERTPTSTLSVAAPGPRRAAVLENQPWRGHTPFLVVGSRLGQIWQTRGESLLAVGRPCSPAPMATHGTRRTSCVTLSFAPPHVSMLTATPLSLATPPKRGVCRGFARGKWRVGWGGSSTCSLCHHLSVVTSTRAPPPLDPPLLPVWGPKQGTAVPSLDSRPGALPWAKKKSEILGNRAVCRVSCTDFFRRANFFELSFWPGGRWSGTVSACLHGTQKSSERCAVHGSLSGGSGAFWEARAQKNSASLALLASEPHPLSILQLGSAAGTPRAAVPVTLAGGAGLGVAGPGRGRDSAAGSPPLPPPPPPPPPPPSETVRGWHFWPWGVPC